MATPAAQAVRDGDTFVHPQSGVTYVRQGGRWIPQGGPTVAAPAAPQSIQIRPPDPTRQYEVTQEQYQAQAAPYQARTAEANARRAEIEAAEAAREAAAGPDTSAGDNVRIDNESALRREFIGRPDVQRYTEVVPLYISARNAADTRAGDLNLTYAFGKIMDPGSVVRESEQEMVVQTGPVADRIRGLLSQINRQGRLSPETRRHLLDELRSRRHELARSYNRERSQYERLAQRHGFVPQDIVGEHPAAPYAAMEQQAREEVSGGGSRDDDDILDIGSLGIGINPDTGQPYTEAEYRAAEEAARRSPNPTAAERFAFRQRNEGPAGLGSLILNGATLDLGDEVAGVGSVISNALAAPFTDEVFDPAGSYIASRDAERMRIEDARRRLGYLGTGAELIGGLGSGRLSPTAITPLTLGARMGQGAIGGAETGALAGFGYADSPRGEVSPLASGRGALTGLVGGAVVGSALPLVGAGIRSALDAGRTMAGRNPDLARRTIAEAIADDANTPIGVGTQMAEAQANGVPMMLADTGENVRGLLAAASRSSGPARTLARDALETRQGGMADRVASAVERDLGPASNPHEVARNLMENASRAAAPLYEAAYARPGADTFVRSVGHLMERPAVRRAMNRAVEIAREEGRDATTLGFELNAAGEAELTRSPSWQTLDYLKRGLDDVLQAQPRDPATGRLRLDEGTKAIDETRREFLRAIDVANPDYAAARAAWAGPSSARDAMQLGQRALSMTADDMTARTASLSPGDLDFFRLGVRRAMAESVASRGDTANVVNTLVGTGRKRAMLQRLFGGRENFDRFVATLNAEQEAFRTYQRAMLGSPTAPNIQDDAALAAATAVTDLGTTGVPITTLIRMAVNFGTSRAGRQAREQITAMLSEADPARLTMLARELRRESARVRQATRARGRRSAGTSRLGGQAAGMVSDDAFEAH